jgi:hypothetical protein
MIRYSPLEWNRLKHRHGPSLIAHSDVMAGATKAEASPSAEQFKGDSTWLVNITVKNLSIRNVHLNLFVTVLRFNDSKRKHTKISSADQGIG